METTQDIKTEKIETEAKVLGKTFRGTGSQVLLNGLITDSVTNNDLKKG